MPQTTNQKLNFNWSTSIVFVVSAVTFFVYFFSSLLCYDIVLRSKTKRQKTSSSGTYKGTKLFSYPKRLFDKLRQMIAETKDNDLWQRGNNLFDMFQLEYFSLLKYSFKNSQKCLSFLIEFSSINSDYQCLSISF